MSSRKSFFLPFTAGIIVGGFVVHYVCAINHKESDLDNEREIEIDNDDITVVSCEYCENKPSLSHQLSSLSISSLYSSFSRLPNFISPDSSNSLTSVYAKLN